jgi:hypothetical protein
VGKYADGQRRGRSKLGRCITLPYLSLAPQVSALSAMLTLQGNPSQSRCTTQVPVGTSVLSVACARTGWRTIWCSTRRSTASTIFTKRRRCETLVARLQAAHVLTLCNLAALVQPRKPQNLRSRSTSLIHCYILKGRMRHSQVGR